jgi:D-alanyl-D-alanine carboxypeptidase
MNPRWAAIAPWCREIALPASVLAVLVALGSASSGTSKVAPFVNRIAPSLTADVKFAGRVEADKSQTTFASADFVKAANTLAVIATATPVTQEPAVTTSSIDSSEAAQPQKPFVVASADPTASIAPVMQATAEPAPSVHEAEPQPKPVVTASLGDPSEVLTPAATPEQTAETGTGDTARQIVGTADILDECYVIDACADRYLWALYERTRKEDTVKEKTRREVTVKRKGKMVTVTRTVTQVVDEDFGWKDPKAADHANMSITDYVIGGMDREFKLRLFRLLLAAEQAGLSPGITSAFRDNYRQSIASGLKAADDRSFHGGSLRGGYGHGLAADIVSVSGATRALRQSSSETLWNWVDKHGKEYGVGRPYHDRDPPHVGPIDGSEYVSRHSGGRSRHASASRARHAAVARADQGVSQRVRTANASAR